MKDCLDQELDTDDFVIASGFAGHLFLCQIKSFNSIGMLTVKPISKNKTFHLFSSCVYKIDKSIAVEHILKDSINNERFS